MKELEAVVVVLYGSVRSTAIKPYRRVHIHIQAHTDRDSCQGARPESWRLRSSYGRRHWQEGFTDKRMDKGERTSYTAVQRPSESM